jgi:hypothetical protein
MGKWVKRLNPVVLLQLASFFVFPAWKVLFDLPMPVDVNAVRGYCLVQAVFNSTACILYDYVDKKEKSEAIERKDQRIE